MSRFTVKSQVCRTRINLADHIPLSTPLVIYVEPSGYCNLKCHFCMHGIPGSGLKEDIMDVPLFNKMIDDLNDFQEKISLLRVCGNGDPLVNKNLIEMLKYARKSTKIERIELVTNGVLLNKNLISELPEYLDRIIISIEGLSDAEFFKVTQRKVDFQKLVNNVQDLYQHRGKCTVHVKIHNEAVTTTEKEKLFFSSFRNYCDEIFIENLVPMWPELDIKVQNQEFRYEGELIPKNVCAQIFKGYQVQADGEVVPCCVDWKRINVIGDINKNSLLDIWNGEPLKKLQYDHLHGKKSLLEPCKSCTMNDYCEIDNIDHFAEIAKTSPFYEQLLLNNPMTEKEKL